MPNGVSSAFRPIAREAAAQWLKGRYSLPPRFILTVGDLQPRKNHLALIRSYEELLRDRPDLPQHLVFVGKRAWRSEQVIAAAKASPVAARIHFMDFVTDEALTRFYGACDLFVYPSLYEGFGLPIIEAMACGRAVACSNTTAMPEVADSAALLFDPKSDGEMIRAMRDLLIDAELRARMERLGLQRASIYNWDRTARQTLEVYYEVAGTTHRAVVRNSIPVR
jgi:glycosyltransferase involved in cell wall biosynthesis